MRQGGTNIYNLAWLLAKFPNYPSKQHHLTIAQTIQLNQFMDMYPPRGGPSSSNWILLAKFPWFALEFTQWTQFMNSFKIWRTYNINAISQMPWTMSTQTWSPTQPYRQCNHNIIIQQVQIKQGVIPTATFHEHYRIHRAIYNLHTRLVAHNPLPPYRELKGS